MYESFDIKPCPNPRCQSADVACYDESIVKGYMAVECRECHMAGPAGWNQQKAVDNWNALLRAPSEKPA